MSDDPTASIETALTQLDEEVTQLQAEQRAFECFTERVATLSVESHSSTVPPATPSLQGTSQSSTATAEIRAIYHETVMALAHYDDVYGDSLADSLIAEFGADIGTVLTGETTLTLPLQTAVCGAASQAATERAAFLDTLATERTTLKEAAATLHDIETTRREWTADQCVTTEDLHDAVATIETLIARCEQVAHERQHHLHNHHQSVSLDGHDLTTYLSQDVDWTYPVLTAVTTLSATLRETRRAVERRLATNDS